MCSGHPSVYTCYFNLSWISKSTKISNIPIFLNLMEPNLKSPTTLLEVLHSKYYFCQFILKTNNIPFSSIIKDEYQWRRGSNLEKWFSWEMDRSMLWKMDQFSEKCFTGEGKQSLEKCLTGEMKLPKCITGKLSWMDLKWIFKVSWSGFHDSKSSWQLRNIMIYFICTAKFLTLFGRWRNIVGSILFVLQDSDIFRQWRNIRIYFICTAKFLTFLEGGGILDLLYLYCKFY